MKLDEFDYGLPPERIAQQPTARRDGSRLMVLDRGSGAVSHRRFSEFRSELRAGDLVVLNDTRVLPARLVGVKASGGRVELLLLEREGAPAEEEVWRCWLKSSRKPAPGGELRFSCGLTARVLSRRDKIWTLSLRSRGSSVGQALERAGRMPLPPYIHREDEGEPPVDDAARYQTVYARKQGAVAAPTAGLHFTRRMLDDLAASGIEIAFVTLHVGPGTFEPVVVERIEDHRMHAERFQLSTETAAAVRRARERKGRVLAVGTTVVRTLEECGEPGGTVRVASGECDLFITPGYRFQVVDALLTNFHLPRSTLLMLVSAFGGRSRLLAAYREAVERDYRFYSYGDAMLIR